MEASEGGCMVEGAVAVDALFDDFHSFIPFVKLFLSVRLRIISDFHYP